MVNLKALFWAGVAAVAVTAAAVTVGAYTGEFGFSGAGQSQATDVVQPEVGSQSDAVVPAAPNDVEYVENEDRDDGDDDDEHEHEYEGHEDDDDDNERDD